MRKLLISILTIIFAMSLVGGDTSAQSPNSVSVGQLYVLQPEWVEVHTAPSAFAPVATKVPQGHVVRVVAGPREVDGLNWWYITPRNYGWVPEVVENIATFELFSNEFMEQTISETNSVLAQDSQNVSALFQRAMAYFALGDHSASIADFDAAIALDNDAAYLYGWRGEVNLDRYTYGDSIADFNEAIALDPTEPNYLIRRGIAREHIYRQYDAEYDYLDAMELVPSYAVPVNNLGNIRRFEGSYTLAISQYEKAMELDPNFGRPYYNRALAKQYQGDYIGALDDYGRALAVDPYDASTYYYRGELLIDYFGNQSAAISDFSNAIELESDFAEAYVARGVAYGLSENYELARSDLEKATELNPNESDGFYNLGSIYAHLGLFEESLTSYEQAMDLSQHWYENGLVYRGQIHLVLGNYSNAADDFTAYIDIIVDYENSYYFDLVAHILRASAYAYLGEYKSAAADLEYAYWGDFVFTADFAYSSGYTVVDNQIERISALQDELEKNPKGSSLYLQIANTYLEASLWEHALDYYQQYLTLIGPDKEGLGDLITILQTITQ